MSLLDWFFGSKKQCAKEHPNEDAMKETINSVNERQKEAANELRKAQLKSMGETEFLRETLRGVLHRVEERKNDEDKGLNG